MLKLELSKYFEYAGIDYKEDFYSDIYHEWEKYTIDDILHNIPKKYDFIDSDLLENNDDLLLAMQRALNRASKAGLVDECYKTQQKAIERITDELANKINTVIWNGWADREGEAIKLTIDWKNWNLLIEGKNQDLGHIIISIINGEGYFEYSSVKEFAECYGGIAEAVKSHLHYLLNDELICEIWGERKGSLDWEVRYWDIDDSVVENEIADCLAELGDELKDIIEDKKYIERTTEQAEANAKKEIERVKKLYKIIK